MPAALSAGPYTFQAYEAWQRQGLQPEAPQAMKLLHRLAADPGIVGIMQKHRYGMSRLCLVRLCNMQAAIGSCLDSVATDP